MKKISKYPFARNDEFTLDVIETHEALVRGLIGRKLVKYNVSLAQVDNMVKYRNWIQLNELAKKDMLFDLPDLILPVSYFKFSYNSGDITSAVIYRYVYIHQKKLSEEDIVAFSNLIISTKNPVTIYKFALNIKGAPVDSLAKALIECENSAYLCLALEHLSISKPVEKIMVDTIIDIGDAEYIFRLMKKYAKDRKVFKELVYALEDSENVIYLTKFLAEFPTNRFKDRIHNALTAQLNRIVKEKNIELIDDYLFELEDEYNVDLLLMAKSKIEHPIKNRNIIIQ